MSEARSPQEGLSSSGRWGDVVGGLRDRAQVYSTVHVSPVWLGGWRRGPVGNMAPSRQKQLEGEMILRLISDGDWLVLMDERGRQFTSMEYADWLQKRMLSGVKRLAIVIGGPYGFSDEVYKRANEKISLSKMTFSHQIVRAIFAEQLYRAFTILNNEPYHHE